MSFLFTLSFPSLYKISATAAFPCAFFDKPLGLPPTLPLLLADYKPALVRSRMISRSNSAKQLNRLKSNRPEEVVVLIGSFKLNKLSLKLF